LPSWSGAAGEDSRRTTHRNISLLKRMNSALIAFSSQAKNGRLKLFDASS
jgi:hypothetical protein